MLRISFKQLIRDGLFGPVRLGVSREEALAALGPPGDWTDITQGASILKYGDVELHFYPQGGLWLIHLEDFDPPNGGKSIELDPWFVRQPLTLAKAEEALSRDGIGYEVTDWEHDESAKRLVAGAGVQFLFTYGGQVLCAMSYSAQPPT